MPLLVIRILLWATILIFPLPSIAGSFRAVPIKIYFDDKTRKSSIEVINDGEEKLTIQIEISKWDQDPEGNDVYEPTKDLIFFPKILNIEPGEEKIIRLGYEGKKGVGVEGTYRLFLQELPVSKPGEVELRMAIRMGLPVFIKPIKEVQKTVIDGIKISDGALKIQLNNGGNSHYIANRITARGIGKTGEEIFSEEITGWYVLAGKTQTYAMEIKGSDCLKTEKIRIEVEGEKFVLKEDFLVTKDMCPK